MPAQRKYSQELRERATRLALESGRPIAHVARDLGVHKEALRTWVRQAKADAAGGAPAVLCSAEPATIQPATTPSTVKSP